MKAGGKTPFIFLLGALALACQTTERPSSAPLAGTAWRVTLIDDREVSEAAPATLSFEKDTERVVGSTGCNNYFGSAEMLGSGMRFTKIGSTRRACPPPMAEQEKRFLDALESIRTHRQRNEFLELLDESGLLRIRLRRSVAASGS